MIAYCPHCRKLEEWVLKRHHSGERLWQSFCKVSWAAYPPQPQSTATKKAQQ